MEREICMINGISCYIYEKKNPKYLLIQPVNEPHAQMLEQQVQFLQENLNRIITETEAFQNESEELKKDLSESKDEISQKEEGIQELKTAASGCGKKEQELAGQREKCQKEIEQRTIQQTRPEQF